MPQNFEQHIEPLAEAIRNYHDQQALLDCTGDLAQATESINQGLELLERSVENRTRLAAAITRLDATIASQDEQHQSEELKAPLITDQPKSKKLNYVDLWQRYSQGISARNPVHFDYLVGCRALENRLSQKEIALMLAAGSPMVQEIRNSSGKQQALHYVNQTAREVWAQKQVELSMPLRAKQQQLELD